MACNHKYATIKFIDEAGEASEWMYEVPRYLRGKVEPGDWMVVEHGRRYKAGEVVETSPVCPYRGDNVGTAIDKVDVPRWRKYLDDQEASRLLMEDMAERAAELDKLGGYAEAAKRDPEMREALEAYRDLSGDPAAEKAAKAAEAGL